MSFDVNKIIEESLKDILIETTGGAITGGILGAGAGAPMPIPGTTIVGAIGGAHIGNRITNKWKDEDEAKEALKKKATEEAKKVAEEEEAKKVAEEAKKVAEVAPEDKEEATTSIAKKVVDAVKEHPGLSAAAAAALAAGVGAMALRNKLKKVKE